MLVMQLKQVLHFRNQYKRRQSLVSHSGTVGVIISPPWLLKFLLWVPQSTRCTCISTWSSRWQVRVQVLWICTRVHLEYKYNTNYYISGNISNLFYTSESYMLCQLTSCSSESGGVEKLIGSRWRTDGVGVKEVNCTSQRSWLAASVYKLQVPENARDTFARRVTASIAREIFTSSLQQLVQVNEHIYSAKRQNVWWTLKKQLRTTTWIAERTFFVSATALLNVDEFG